MLSLLRESLDVPGFRVLSDGCLGEAFDFVEFERLLCEHRVLLPVWRELNRGGRVELLSSSCRDRISALNTQQTMRQMKVTARLLEIVKLFDAEGVPYVTLKGPAFSQWLFGNPVHRHCNDLDILVSKKDFHRAERALQAIGVNGVSEPIEFRRERGAELWGLSHHRHFAGNGISLELHWRLSGIDCFYSVEPDQFLNASQPVEIAGYPVSVAGDGYMADYLTLHGSAHCWNRLKWIYDIACVRHRSGQVFELSANGPRDFSGNRIWRDQLLDCLFGSVSPSSWSPRTKFATGMSLKQLADSNLYPGSAINVLRRTVAMLLVAGGVKARWKYIVQVLSWKPCYQRFPLPESMAFLYLLIGPFYWLYKVSFLNREGSKA